MSLSSSEGSEDTAQQPSVNLAEFDDTAAAGDWGLYLRRCAYINASPLIKGRDAIALKRRFGLAYLGTRAQALGGVYMRSRPSVFTPLFVERMASENATKRFARYPWLERLIHLLQQLDQDQYRSAPQQASIVMNPKPPPRLQVVPNNFA